MTKTKATRRLGIILTLLLIGCATQSDWERAKYLDAERKINTLRQQLSATIVGLMVEKSSGKVIVYNDDKIRDIARILNISSGMPFDTSRSNTPYNMPLGSYFLPMTDQEIQFEAYSRLWRIYSLIDFEAPHSLQHGEGLLRVTENGFDIGRGVLTYEKERSQWKIYTDWNKSVILDNKNISDINNLFISFEIKDVGNRLGLILQRKNN